MVQSSLTQALATGIAGIILMAFNILALGPVVDYFVAFASTLTIDHIWARECMSSIMLYGQWFYWLCTIMAMLFVIYPIIYVIFRHRYISVEPIDEGVIQGQ